MFVAKEFHSTHSKERSMMTLGCESKSCTDPCVHFRLRGLRVIALGGP